MEYVPPTVVLKHHTPLTVAAEAIRTCWQSFDKSDSVDGICGEADKALIDRVGNKFKHASTLEHLTYNFQISGISRALLQELARHRMANLSVKSSRYTLKELKEEESFSNYSCVIDGELEWCTDDAEERASKYIIFTGNKFVDTASIVALDSLRDLLDKGISNDIVKYCMPESYKTELAWSINARSLQNFLSLRSNKAALWEIRELAKAVYFILPEEHKYLFEGCMA